MLDHTASRRHETMKRGLDLMFRTENPERARTAFSALVDEFNEDPEKALAILEQGIEDAIAMLSRPPKYRRPLGSTNTLERLIEEGRRRKGMIRIFPNDRSACRLVGALLGEQHEEWITGRRYFEMAE